VSARLRLTRVRAFSLRSQWGGGWWPQREPRGPDYSLPVGARHDVIASRGDTLLRVATKADLDAVDFLTVEAYRPIQASYVSMLGEACYEAVRQQPELTWEERKTRQNRELFAEHPDQLWVLAADGEVFGYVSFWIFPGQSYGHIDNNAVRADRAGRGWGAFMYRHVLDHFRERGLRFAHVDTGLDDAHIAARRAYEAVGFDRAVPGVDYWQDLKQLNPGSTASRPAGSERPVAEDRL
jgi:ribosomal protein S18 acetylase RimI-like enzyme